MVFSSFDFLFRFLPVFLFLYFICPERQRNLCLFVGSLVFYFYVSRQLPLYFLLLLLSMAVNFFIGRRIGRKWNGPERAVWLTIGIIYNLLWLMSFKYSAFFAENTNALLTYVGLSVQLPVLRPALPLGISFYTFQAIAYLADVYRKKIRSESSLLRFGTWFTMFTQVTSGPITRYQEVRPQLLGRKLSLDRLETGLREFTIGLSLKVLLANQLGGLWNQVNAIGYESISTPLAWMGIIAFSLQLYFDFYGYSLMAQGLGWILGFQIPRNFAHPYQSLSMTEFWRRWHMTLGKWFKDYIYIPLGGNRRGTFIMVRNLLAVWLLTGFWHGADWNFLLWGLLLFVLISLEKLGLGTLLNRFPALGHIYMAFVIPLNWLVFAISQPAQILIYLQRLFPFFNAPGAYTWFAGDYLKYGQIYGLSLIAGLIFVTDLPRRIYNRYRTTFVTALGLVVLFWICIYCIKMGMDDPFLYFRF